MFTKIRNALVLGLGLSVSGIVGWLLLREAKREKTQNRAAPAPARQEESEDVPHIVLPLDELEEPEAEPTAQTEEPEQSDDLTLINDIGPRFARALNDIGITRFAQLAQHTPEDLANRLSAYVTVRAQRIRSNDWIGQASRLAQE
jgi:predicted flap endonuclease-1-like 5' DNA nuclease